MYVLQDSLETSKRGKPVYLWKQTGIGPAYTESLEDAEKFDDEKAAMRHPAYLHPMCFFEPAPV